MAKRTVIEIIGFLQEVTSNGAIQWENIGNDIFSTSIDKCKINISSNYDGYNNDYYVNLTFFNVDGVQFDSVTYYETPNSEIYKTVHDLYNLISDKYYKKSESERIIISGLKKLIHNQTEP